VLREYCAPIAEEEEECGAAGVGGERKKSAATAVSKRDGSADVSGKPKQVPVAVGKFGVEVGEERAVSPLSKV
jgi:hypothetical protein